MQVRLWHLMLAVFLLSLVFAYVRLVGPDIAIHPTILIALLLAQLAAYGTGFVHDLKKALRHHARRAVSRRAVLLNLAAFVLDLGYGIGSVVFVVVILASAIATVGLLLWLILL